MPTSYLDSGMPTFHLNKGCIMVGLVRTVSISGRITIQRVGNVLFISHLWVSPCHVVGRKGILSNALVVNFILPS